jgi:ADP-ribosylglycohydrolase
MKFTNSSLVADALSLGPHWVYNQGKLARLYADGIFNYTDPASSFHPHRKAGEFTHYGDQTVMLAESIKAQGSFSIDTWRADWLKNMKAYDGYLDGASKQTLESKGAAPSDSNDLAGASRIGPILDLQLPLEAAISAAREQTALTHGDAGVIDAAEFFVRAVDALQSGADMAAALQKAATEGNYTELDAEHSLKKAVIAETDDFLKVSREMGLTCHLPEAFPLTLYFALRPDVTAQQTLSDNGVAGGDTSARAMLLAILFAARDGDISELYPAPSALETVEVNPGSNAVGIATPKGRLAGILEMPPSGETLAFALFAHCFTCGKDFVPENALHRISPRRELPPYASTLPAWVSQKALSRTPPSSPTLRTLNLQPAG